MLLALLLSASACAGSDSPSVVAAELASADEAEIRPGTPDSTTVDPNKGADASADASSSAESTAEPTQEPAAAAAVREPTVVATTAPVELQPTPESIAFERPASPAGRTAPVVASTAAELAAQVETAEQVMADPASTAQELADAGHLHQVAIRKIGYESEWDIEFFEALPADLRARTNLHVAARRALIDLHSGYDAADFIPAWEIVDPEPAESLVSYYQEAEAATGIEWEYLAAINLIETGMGRIRGLSSAGAQGPMQFLPTTWAEPGIGQGDINDPSDAINAAARYLVRRGGPEDMPGALWGYNNSDNYVTAVRAYAELLRQDPAAYTGIYNWEIYFYTEAGDVWLPADFRTDESIDLADFLESNPWSVPDPGLR